jgi:hypothetical protein
MSLKNLTFATVPLGAGKDPITIRRQRIVERLQEQIQLAKDPNFAPKVKRWVKDDQGNRNLMETTKRISPWWVTDANGEVFLTVKAGLKKVEFEKGKSAIKVGASAKLESVLQTLVEATNAGELDAHIATPSSPYISKLKG